MTYAIPMTIIGALILLAMCARAIKGTAHEQKES